MKNAVLASLFLLGISNVFGVTVEKNNISIQYDVCTKYDLPGSSEKPYCVIISNHSKEPIMVDSSIIGVPLRSNDEIIKEARFNLKALLLFGSILAGIGGYRSYKGFRIMPLYHAGLFYNPIKLQPVVQHSLDQIRARTIVSLVLAIASGTFSTYALYRLLSGTVLNKSKLLSKPFTIKPGELIEKLFWLKNPKDQIKINFDAIKVLK